MLVSAGCLSGPVTGLAVLHPVQPACKPDPQMPVSWHGLAPRLCSLVAETAEERRWQGRRLL